MTFPLLDDAGQPRSATMTELREAINFGVYRSQEAMTRILKGVHSETAGQMVDGSLPLPKVVVVVYDPEYNPVVYVSDDDENCTVV